MIKINNQPNINLKSYLIIQRAIEEGIDYGYSRAHKHTSEPKESDLKEEIERAIMIALDEILDFD